MTKQKKTPRPVERRGALGGFGGDRQPTSEYPPNGLAAIVGTLTLRSIHGDRGEFQGWEVVR